MCPKPVVVFCVVRCVSLIQVVWTGGEGDGSIPPQAAAPGTAAVATANVESFILGDAKEDGMIRVSLSNGECHAKYEYIQQ
jgi:hypothetical protein